MRLGIQMLDNVSTLNSLKYANQITLSPGETSDIYFQIVDLDNQISANYWSRYIPAAGATVKADLFSNNNTNMISKFCSQPFTLDSSIWKFSVSDIDTMKMAGVNIKITLIQGAQINIGWAKNSIIMLPQSPFQG